MIAKILGMGSLLWFALAVQAQTYKSPQYNHCVRDFYDPKMYNWLAYENVCGEPIQVTFIPYSPGYGGGAMSLSPLRHDSTGYNRNEVSRMGGFELYICPAGYIPVNANDRYVTRVNTAFHCKRK